MNLRRFSSITGLLAVSLALASGALVPPASIADGNGAAVGSSTARASSGCLKLWHKKRVVKYVKKNGKPVKTYRMKIWWTCDPLEAPGPPRLSVAASEFKLTLSRPYVKSGGLILEYNNRGEDSHNLAISRISPARFVYSLPELEPRQLETGTYPLAPGSYRLYCTLPNHAKLGMTARLKVIR